MDFSFVLSRGGEVVQAGPLDLMAAVRRYRSCMDAMRVWHCGGVGGSVAKEITLRGRGEKRIGGAKEVGPGDQAGTIAQI
jgi:hypothetical protein